MPDASATRTPRAGAALRAPIPAPIVQRSRLRLALAGLALALPTACTVGPDPRPPPAPEGTYTAGPPLTGTAQATGTSQRFDYGNAVSTRWWQRFQAPALDAAVATALEASPNLERALSLIHI